MKVLLISDAYSIHTIKWAKSLSKKGIEIAIFSLNYNENEGNPYQHNNNIKVYYCVNKNAKKRSSGFAKISYLKALPGLKQVLRKFKPDIVHAHYASSYGLLGALSGFSPYIISVWGSDVFDFPNISFLHKMVIKYNLSKADKILSTSKVMAIETNKYTDKEVVVTPFGIDLDKFKPLEVNSLFDKNDIVIGTVKTLEEKYGIEYLIKAFAVVKDKYKYLPLKLLIVGAGSLSTALKELTYDLGIEKDTVFTGKIAHELVPVYDNMLSVSVSVSNSESFGVAVIEASACGKPVVVSDVGGLPEVVKDGITGIVVPPRNPQETAEAIEKLVLDDSMRKQMGAAGREHVAQFYDWNKNVEQMVDIYKDILNLK